MPSAINIDRSPRAPGQTLTPYELARARKLLGKWLVCPHHPPAPGPCAHGDSGQYRARQTAADIVPHTYEPHDGTCVICPLPASHKVHRVVIVAPDVIDADLRMLGEREEQPA